MAGLQIPRRGRGTDAIANAGGVHHTPFRTSAALLSIRFLNVRTISEQRDVAKAFVHENITVRLHGDRRARQHRDGRLHVARSAETISRDLD